MVEVRVRMGFLPVLTCSFLEKHIASTFVHISKKKGNGKHQAYF